LKFFAQPHDMAKMVKQLRWTKAIYGWDQSNGRYKIC